MDRFVCVLITRISHLNKGLFRFDPNLSFAVMFMNADLDIYGRYGTRAGGGYVAANRPEGDTSFQATKDISLASFRKALERALELHASWKKDKRKVARALAPKMGRTYLDKAVRRPRSLSGLARSTGCVHCHQLAENEARHYWNKGRSVPDRLLWGFPMPDILGFTLDPDECATVKSVVPGGEAEKAGLQAGDRIRSAAGQPVLSIADVQWTLHQAPDRGTLRLVTERGGTERSVSLTLPDGWRRRSPFAWRYAYNELKWKVAGLDQLSDLDDSRRQAMGIGPGESAIRIGQVIRGTGRWQRTYCNLEAWKIGIRPGDIIVDVDGRGRLDQSGFLAYILQKTRPRQTITLRVLRNGSRKVFRYPLKALK